MKVKIISVGKVKDKGLNELINYYAKQIKTIEMIEITDEASITGMEKEGQKILSKIAKDSYVISLAIEGKMLDSVGFAETIDHVTTNFGPSITFIIGGSFGLSNNVKENSNLLLSFSKMTFPHQLMKLFLVEQIFRAQAILNNHPYHK
ncbi:23S rRNA (pseudouridine(1915)-N(3))-methyltransferase RlmH [Acholeplasma laidlawii]|uniref:23S rRNA (pseudouridine(1915)-N(3))-methyltransferase RlmH n=1 Tax=Acholeplasma laidlawii TaxID=2148 RepID=UPI0018C27533|nr:23S rRNA (pseudouridine(1915)-N(3))-methyltransferase RlmH [Acholeplasma laidlawii]MBG0762473.1 23S rRNA (pseudouridine(1915)-N(3))-methyltransferase RlmH [Acholeplasma laidlawii]